MNPIAALNESIPVIIEKVVAQSAGKSYYNEFGAAKSEKIRMMTSELLESVMGYLKTASLEHARAEMKAFDQNTPSADSGLELKALWSDIIAVATLENPSSEKLLHQLSEVFNRLIAECSKR